MSKKNLSAAQLEQRRNAGKSLVAKRGLGYMSQIGRAGYEKVIATCPDWHERGGQASWEKQNAGMIKDGYFPNQSLKQWGYSK